MGEEMNTFFFEPRAPTPWLRVRGVGWVQQGEGHCSERDFVNEVVVSLKPAAHQTQGMEASSFPSV